MKWTQTMNVISKLVVILAQCR